MTGFDFGQTKDLFRDIMDTDTIDIGRRMEIQNPDGSWGETDPNIPFYVDIPCHVAFNSTDNAGSTSDISPIIISITIHCDTEIDLQNNDYITARKLDSKGEELEVYTGVCGFHTVNQNRQSVQMVMKKG